MAAQNDPLDPDWIASQEFDSSFRGFDQSQVRSYLRQLAKALRTEQDAAVLVSSASQDQSEYVAGLEEEVATLRLRTDRSSIKLDEAKAEIVRLEALPTEVAPAELDPGELTKLLGEETVRVLDSARSAAADIRGKAEREAEERTTAIDKVQASTNKELGDKRKVAEEEVATLRSDADTLARETVESAQTEAAKLRSESQEASETLRADAQAESTRLTDESQAAAAASKTAATAVAAAVKQRGEDVAKETRLSAESEGAEIRKAAAQVRSDAEAEGARLRAEAAADVETARDSAREEARLMLTEAQSLREKVLEDLVKRRRTARQQIDQAKAARDRLSRALVVASVQIDEACSELDLSLPEARKAMKLTRTRPGATETEQMVAIAQGLDDARSVGKTLSPERVSQSKDGPSAVASPDADNDAASGLADRAAAGSVASPGQADARDSESAGADAGSTKSDRAVSGSTRSGSTKSDRAASGDGTGGQGADARSGSAKAADDVDSAESSRGRDSVSNGSGDDDLVDDLDDEGVEAAASDDLDSIFARIRASGSQVPGDSENKTGSESRSGSESGASPSQTSASRIATSQSATSQSATSQSATSQTAVAQTAASPNATSLEQEGDADEVSVATDPAPADSSNKDGSDEFESDEEMAEVLPPFTDRDIAATRFGPDLRRKLKRALADDQSDVLDRVRRANKLSTADLPEVDVQLSGFREAALDGLLSIGSAGAASLGGGDLAATKLDKVIEQLALAIQGPLRSRIDRAVNASDGDGEEVLEPIRAHYRDTRSSVLPELVDDAIAEAFAVGAYETIAKKAKLVWVLDPRVQNGPDCYDNTLEDSVHKPDAFPTGHKVPLRGPGCRCLVLPADRFS